MSISSLLAVIIIVCCVFNGFFCKYLEGELKTHENWAFLARFCFLSEQGQFEYEIEFNAEQGNPNLLLYYDTEDQWPSVYKTNKTCYEREAVLNMEQNQIINLTTQYPRYRDLAGCMVIMQNGPTTTTTAIPKYTKSVTTTKQPQSLKPLINREQEQEDKSENKFSSTESTNLNEINYTTIDYNNSVNFTDYVDVSEKMFDFEGDLNETDFVSTTKAPIKKRSVVAKPPSKNKIVSKKMVVCQNSRRFQSSRERWWFVAVSNCNSTKGINIKFRILMTNGPPGDYWHEHFSADQFYILPVLMAFSIAYSFLMLAIVLCSVELKSRQLLHSTYKLFVLSAIVQFFGVILHTSYFLKYAVNGIGAPTVKTFGSMFMSCSETCFLLLLLLLAKGYTITRGRLPLAASVKLTIFMCLYSVTYICIFIYEAKVFDPGEVLYLYESPAGYGLIILRIIAWLMFVYSTVFTLKHYPEKANFYYPFNICGTLWFIAGPAFILSANSYIDKWVRESVVCAVLLLITFGGHLNFLILTMPSMANKNFPYHVRTSQIGVMELTGAAGASTIEHFSHHVYEPASNVTEQTVIIPLTRRTEEIFGGFYSEHLHNNFARNTQRQSIPVAKEEMNASQSIAMQNVLTWSLAKNCPTLDISQFERTSRESDNLNYSARSKELEPISRRGSSIDSGENSQRRRSSQYEYVKDVPLELFTVSKMVVKGNSTTHDNEAQGNNTQNAIEK